MNDTLVRILVRTANIRGLACITTDLVNEACRRHATYPTASAALGRVLTGAALMGALLKTGQRVALKFEGDGPLRKIIAEAESSGEVRGYVEVPQVDLPLKHRKLDVSGALGRNGLLTVSKDLRLKEPYKGTVQLLTGEIAEDLAFYLTESEQVPSAVGLGVYVAPNGTVMAAGGFLIQSLPPADEEAVGKLIAHIEAMKSITELLREGKEPEDLLELIFGDIPFEILEKRPLKFQCSCSRETVERALISLGVDELSTVAQEEDSVEVTCEFCRQTYTVTREELERLLRELQ